MRHRPSRRIPSSACRRTAGYCIIFLLTHTHTHTSLDVDDFKHWVEESTGVPITIFTPPDYTKLAMNLGMLLGVLMFVKLAFAHFYALLTNPLPWMVASLLFVINMNR